jgi:hypothetical protein
MLICLSSKTPLPKALPHLHALLIAPSSSGFSRKTNGISFAQGLGPAFPKKRKKKNKNTS